VPGDFVILEGEGKTQFCPDREGRGFTVAAGPALGAGIFRNDVGEKGPDPPLLPKARDQGVKFRGLPGGGERLSKDLRRRGKFLRFPGGGFDGGGQNTPRTFHLKTENMETTQPHAGAVFSWAS